MLLRRLAEPALTLNGPSRIARSVGHGSPSVRTLSSKTDLALHRSYLYVPSSSDRMLDKSLSTPSDVIIYDLEDSVSPSPSEKDSARRRLSTFLKRTPQSKLPHPNRIAVRLNAINTPFFESDISEFLKSPFVRTLVLPKINSVRDLHYVSRAIQISRAETSTSNPIRIVASIESALSVWNLGEIASWTSKYSPDAGGSLGALLFAAEDYCADTSVVRTPSRLELLYVRSQIAIAAKAFGLDAIDMVCVNYKDLDYLKDECEDGRRLGFNGKQAIHPAQVDIIHSTFVPAEREIIRAAKILHQMEVAHSSQKGAFGLDMEGGGKEMIDAPMLKQAENTIRVAKAAGLDIPVVGANIIISCSSACYLAIVEFVGATRFYYKFALTCPTMLTQDFHLDTFFNSVWMSGPHVFSFNSDGTVKIPKVADPTPAPYRFSNKVALVHKTYAAAAKSALSQGLSDKPWKNVAIIEQDDAEFEEWKARMASTGDVMGNGVPLYTWSSNWAVHEGNMEVDEVVERDDEEEYGNENVPPEILYGGSPTVSASTEESPLIHTPTRYGDGVRRPLAILYEGLVEAEDGALEKVVGLERLRRKAPPPLCLDYDNGVGDDIDRINGILLNGGTADETEQMLSPLTAAFGMTSQLTGGLPALSLLHV